MYEPDPDPNLHATDTWETSIHTGSRSSLYPTHFSIYYLFLTLYNTCRWIHIWILSRPLRVRSLYTTLIMRYDILFYSISNKTCYFLCEFRFIWPKDSLIIFDRIHIWASEEDKLDLDTDPKHHQQNFIRIRNLPSRKNLKLTLYFYQNANLCKIHKRSYKKVIF